MRYHLLCIIGGLLFVRCHTADPTACLDATNPTIGKVGMELVFKSCSSNVHHEEWNFGDNSAILSGIMVSHTFMMIGNYTLKLKVYNEDKSVSDSISSIITISQ